MTSYLCNRCSSVFQGSNSSCPFCGSGKTKKLSKKKSSSIETAKRQQQREMKDYTEMWERVIYPTLLTKFNIPMGAYSIKMRTSTDSMFKAWLENRYMRVWVSDDCLYLFPELNDDVEMLLPEKELNEGYVPIKIPISSIDYFAVSGEHFRETKISGGGGGGSDIGGAIVGGIIAGGAGAIIGSRKETNSITSKTITHDNRETILRYFGKGKRQTIWFRYDDFNKLEDLIPHKNYDIVSSSQKNVSLEQKKDRNKPHSVSQQIREIAKLHVDGILTDEEFSKKKKELLEKI
jgi:DNA-directed RNA polymerase subunit RPC12/RpoP